MELSEALNFVDSLNLDEKPLDFSEFTDEQLLSISITLDLLSLDEAKAFELELNKRQLTERYFSMRKPKTSAQTNLGAFTAKNTMGKETVNE